MIPRIMIAFRAICSRFALVLVLALAQSVSAPPSQSSTLETGSWDNLFADTEPVSAWAHAAVRDPVRSRMIVFGGVASNGYATNAVWALALTGTPGWSRIMPSGTPPTPRIGHSAIYDPIRDRVLVYGGHSYSAGPTIFDQVWALDLSGTPSWSQLTIAGTHPSARYEHSAIYDPVRDQMIVFGGSDDSNDVWSLSLSGTPAWSQLAPAGTAPAGRHGHSAVYHAAQDRMIVFGGATDLSTPVPMSDTWELDLAGGGTWTEISTSSTPPARFEHTAIVDVVGNRMLIHSGTAAYEINPAFVDVWAFDLGASPGWSQLSLGPVFPRARTGHGAIYDAPGNRMMMFGGLNLGTATPGDETWQLTLSGTPTWSRLNGLVTVMPKRESHSVIYDPTRQRLVVFGGTQFEDIEMRNDVWVLPLTGSSAWQELVPAGTPPSPRYDHTAIYDSNSDRMIVYAGGGGNGEVWSLSFSPVPAWTQLSPSGTAPSPRSQHVAIYDSARDRMVVHGGGYPEIPETWALSLGAAPAWTQISAPCVSCDRGVYYRRMHSAIYDPIRDRMVTFGGFSITESPGNRNDVLALSFVGPPAWNLLATTGTPPSIRNSHTSAYDPVRDRMMVFGGNAGLGLNDTYALDLRANPPQWSQVTTSPPAPDRREKLASAFDVAGDRFIIVAGHSEISPGSDTYEETNDVWALTVDAPTATLVAGFEATAKENVVEVRWRLGTPERIQDVRLLRALDPSGPWIEIAEVPYRDGEWSVIVDRSSSAALRHYRLDLTLVDGAETTFGPVAATLEASMTKLVGVSPNPSAGSLFVSFALEREAPVRVRVIDALGREVARLVDRTMARGRHTITWDGQAGRNPAAAGLYFVTWEASGRKEARRIAIVR